MDGHLSETGVPVTIGKHRRKILACVVVGISVICTIAVSGYLAYGKIQDNSASSAQLPIIASQTSLLSATTTRFTPASMQTMISKIFTEANTSDAVANQPQTMYSSRPPGSSTQHPTEQPTTVSKVAVKAVANQSSTHFASTNTFSSSSTGSSTQQTTEQPTTVNKVTVKAVANQSSTHFASTNTFSSSPTGSSTQQTTELPTTVNKATVKAVANQSSTQFASRDTDTPSYTNATILKTTEQATSVNTGPSKAVTNQPLGLEKSEESEESETSTLSTTEQTFTGDKTTTGPPLSCTTGSTSALPLDISEINSDLCLSVTSDVCNNVTESVPDYCECDADGIWTIIQKRFDGSVDFYRSWVDYKEGFGCLNGEYWLGNDLIHLMTSNKSYTLKIVPTDWENVTKYAQYDTFRIADEADG